MTLNLKYRRLLVGCAIWLVGVGAGCWAPPALAQTATFDFDTATPTLATGQFVPFDQTVEGFTAHFSADSEGFSVQDYLSTFLNLSLFFGNYIYPNEDDGILEVQFSQQITNLVLDFATTERIPFATPTPVRLIAYTNSTATPPVGSTTLAGTYFGGNALPMGTLTFNSATPFNLIVLNIQPGGASGFMVDNISVQASGGDQYTITTSASPISGGTTTGDGSYLIGSTVTVTASPNEHYAFVNWTEDGVEISTEASFQFQADSFRTLVANFVRTWTITTSALPPSGGSTTGDGEYPDGSSVLVTATANPGYAFVNWTDNGDPVGTRPFFFFVASSDQTLVANFAPACTISTSPSSTEEGTTRGDGTYAIGSPITVLAVPRTGYAFVNWTENGSEASQLASYGFNGSGDRTLVANFTPNSSMVTFDFDTGTPTLTNTQVTPFEQFSGGLTAHFSSTNDPAFWVGSDADIGWVLSKFSSNYLASGVSMSPLDIQFSQPVTEITLTFATLDFEDLLESTTIELDVYASSTATPPLGVTTAQGTYTTGDLMPMGTLAFSSTTPFQVVRILLPSTPEGAMDFVVDNITVQTAGGSSYMIETSASPGAGGSASGGGTVNSGASVTVVATANAGYAFVNWTENGTPVSTSTSYTFTAGADRSLFANFAPQLGILLTSINGIVITWPATASEYVLQENTVLGSTNWVDTTNAVSIIGDQAQVEVSPLAANGFYRLFRR